MPDLSSTVTQAAFGEMVGVSQQAVSDLLKRGVLQADDTAQGWLLAYCANLRETAAGRASAGDLDLAQERAALAREQRERIALANAKTRGDQAPIEILGDALAKSIEIMVSELDQIDGLIAQTAPDLPDATRAAVLSCVTAARNKIATRGAQLVTAAIAPEDDIDEGLEADEEAAT